MKINQTKRRKSLAVEQLNVEIPATLHHRLKIVAALERRSFKQITIDALTEFYEARKGSLKLPFNPPAFQSAGLQLAE
jgi:hypothetical protein